MQTHFLARRGDFAFSVEFEGEGGEASVRGDWPTVSIPTYLGRFYSPRAPSIHIMPTLGPKVYDDDLRSCGRLTTWRNATWRLQCGSFLDSLWFPG